MKIDYEIKTIGFLDLTFGPKWDYIPITRNYIENFLMINIDDKYRINKITMAASELLENAVKYSNRDGVRIIISKNDHQKNISLKVLNYADKETAMAHIGRINKMNEYKPLEYYIERMKDSVTRTDGKAGLGLARINHEANATISALFYDETSVLEVSAIFKLSE